MLPGFVSGFYTYDECHIDLERLTSWAKARLIHAEASSIDPKVRLAFAMKVGTDVLVPLLFFIPQLSSLQAKPLVCSGAGGVQGAST